MNKYKNTLSVFDLSFKNICLILGMCVSLILSILSGILFSNILDLLSESQMNKSYEMNKILLFFVLTVLSSAASVIFSQFLPLSFQLKKSIHTSQNTMAGLLNMSQKSYKKFDSGYYMNLTTSSSFTYGDICSHMNIQLPANILCVIIILLFVMNVSLIFGLIFIAYIPLFYLVVRIPGRKVAEFQKSGLPTQDAFLSETKRIVDSKREINIAGVSSFYISRYKDKSNEFLNFMQKFKLFDILSQNVPDALSKMFQVFTFCVSVFLFYQERLTIGTIILVFQLSSLMQNPVNRCFEILIHKTTNKVHLERLQEFANLSKEKSGFDKYYKSISDVAIIKNTDFFTSDDKEKLLFHIDELIIKKKDLIVIKGANGTGKSMFVNFLTGFSEADSINGFIEMDNSLKFSSYLSYPIIFINGTLSDNMFDGIVKEELFDVLDIDFKDKIIEDSGNNLSLGQRQKLHLLRTLSKETNLFILDEPFSNLDKETVIKLTEYIISLKGEKTVLVIVHSDEFDRYANMILRIENQKMCQIS